VSTQNISLVYTFADLEHLLSLFAFENTEMLWWRGSDGAENPPLRFYVNCNDTFSYASADCEEIRIPTDLPSLEKAKAESPDEWPLLWVARKRNKRPIRPLMDHMDAHDRKLFEAIGD
jgi:hypothetical protein